MIWNRYLQLARLGLRQLLGYPLRTFLTTLGVVFGVGSVIAMLAVGAGAERELLRQFGRLGTRNIILNSVKPEEKRRSSGRVSFIQRYGLTYRDERQIRETVPGAGTILAVHQRPRAVWYGSRKAEATAYAVEPAYMDLFGLRVSRGRSLTASDNDNLARVCVIRPKLVRDLGCFEDPVGLSLQLDNEFYEIVGVLGDEEFLGYAQEALAIDDRTMEVYVPYRTFQKRLGTTSIRRRAGSFEASNVELSQIVVSVGNIEDVLMVARMLQRVLEKNHEDRDWRMVVPLEVLRQQRKTQEVFNIALVAIASISLLVGGIGIANIMLATVTERTREIGIRRALGAKRRHIMAQFLAETILISLVGGLLGVACGIGIVALLGAFTTLKGVITAPSILLAIVISVGVGIVSGIFPARRAARLDPIAALRHE